MIHMQRELPCLNQQLHHVNLKLSFKSKNYPVIFLLVKTGRRSLFIFFPISDSCVRTTSADLCSLGKIIRTGAFAWISRTWWFHDSMDLVMVELMRFSGYFSFKKILHKVLHSSANSWFSYDVIIFQNKKISIFVTWRFATFKPDRAPHYVTE